RRVSIGIPPQGGCPPWHQLFRVRRFYCGLTRSPIASPFPELARIGSSSVARFPPFTSDRRSGFPPTHWSAGFRTRLLQTRRRTVGELEGDVFHGIDDRDRQRADAAARRSAR